MAGGETEATANYGPPSDPNDLMYSIEGMYRILDLVSETGSGGLGTTHISAFVGYPLTMYNSGKGHHQPRIIEAFRQQGLSRSLCLFDKDRFSGA